MNRLTRLLVWLDDRLPEWLAAVLVGALWLWIGLQFFPIKP